MSDYFGPLNLILLAVPGIALRVAVRVLYGPRPKADGEPFRAALLVAGTLLITAGLVGGVFAVAGPGIVPLGILAAIAAFTIADRMRRAEHRALLWSLAVAAERGIPLSEAARAYADENLGDRGTRAMRLALAIEQGIPLSQAIVHARLRLAAPMRLAVRLGESLGVLGTAMRQQLDDSQQADAAVRDTLGRFAYLAVVISMMLSVLTFIMLKIVPVYVRMFEEFGLELPEMTKLVINFSNSFVDPQVQPYIAGAVSLGLLLIGLVLFVILLLSLISGPERMPRNRYLRWLTRPTRLFIAILVILVCAIAFPLGLLRFLVLAPIPLLLLVAFMHFVGWAPRDLPLVWRLFRRYDGAMMMRGVALAVRRQLPLPQALDLVAEMYPVRHAAGALAVASDHIKQGMDWPESLRRSGLIAGVDAAVLASAERAGNLPWALEEMAENGLRRTNLWLQVALQMLFPPAVLLVGTLVMFFVVGLFLPLISLIQALT